MTQAKRYASSQITGHFVFDIYENEAVSEIIGYFMSNVNWNNF